MMPRVLESPPGIVIFALDRAYRYLAFNQNHATTMRRIWGASIHVGDSMLAVTGSLNTSAMYGGQALGAAILQPILLSLDN